MRATLGPWAARALGLCGIAVLALTAPGPAMAKSSELREICSTQFLGYVTLTTVIDLPLKQTTPPTVGRPTKGGRGTAQVTIPRSIADEVRRFGDPTVRVSGTLYAQIRTGSSTAGDLVEELPYTATGSARIPKAGSVKVSLTLTTKGTFTPQVSGRHSIQAGTMILRLDNAAFEVPVKAVCVTDPTQDPGVLQFDVQPAAPPPLSQPRAPEASEPPPVVPVAPVAPVAAPPTLVQADLGSALIPGLVLEATRLSERAAPPRPEPARITVGSPRTGVLVDAPLSPSQAGPDGVWSPPAGRVGWYAAAGWATPGRPGTAVLAGHVGSALGGPDVFARLPEAVVGDEVTVTTAAGTPQRFVVTRSQAVPKGEVPDDASIWGPSVGPELRLITCDPASAFLEGHFTGNWVLWATPR